MKPELNSPEEFGTAMGENPGEDHQNEEGFSVVHNG